jgi:hypothetical protein
MKYIKQAIFIATIISTLLVSAKGTMTRTPIKSFGKTYYKCTVVRVDTLQETFFNDSTIESILENDIIHTTFIGRISTNHMLFVTTINDNTDSLMVSEREYLRERGAQLNFTGYMRLSGKTIVIQKEVCDKYCTMRDKTIVKTYKYSWDTAPSPDAPTFWRIAIHDDTYHLYGPIIKYIHEKAYNRLGNRSQAKAI